MKQLQRFRVGDKVLRYSYNGYNMKKHIILFIVRETTRTNLVVDVTYATYLELCTNSCDRVTGVRVDESFFSNETSTTQTKVGNLYEPDNTYFRLSDEEYVTAMLGSI